MADQCVNLLTLHSSESQENSNYFTASDRRCSVSSRRIQPFCLQGVKFQNCRFIDLGLNSCYSLALIWRKINPSSLLKVESNRKMNQLCLHLRLRPGYMACRKTGRRKIRKDSCYGRNIKNGCIVFAQDVRYYFLKIQLSNVYYKN